MEVLPELHTTEVPVARVAEVCRYQQEVLAVMAPMGAVEAALERSRVVMQVCMVAAAAAEPEL
jgi:hypothetical protein